MATMVRILGRLGLAVVLIVAGIGHFTSADAFLAQVPPWMPAPEAVVAVSGVVELILGTALIVIPRRWRPALGWVTAGFFVVIFPGNISQFVTGTSAFGLDSDAARFVRLLFQPALVVWALWCTGAWSARSARRNKRSASS